MHPRKLTAQQTPARSACRCCMSRLIRGAVEHSQQTTQNGPSDQACAGFSLALWQRQNDCAKCNQCCPHLDDQLDSVLQANVVLVLLLQDVLRGLLVGANCRRLPAAIIAAGIALVQLIPAIPSSEQLYADAPLITRAGSACQQRNKTHSLMPLQCVASLTNNLSLTWLQASRIYVFNYVTHVSHSRRTCYERPSRRTAATRQTAAALHTVCTPAVQQKQIPVLPER